MLYLAGEEKTTANSQWLFCFQKEHCHRHLPTNATSVANKLFWESLLADLCAATQFFPSHCEHAVFPLIYYERIALNVDK